MLIECKVSGSAVNSYKRLNHETVNKRDEWERGFAAQAYTGAVLGGVFRPSNVLAAQERGCLRLVGTRSDATCRVLEGGRLTSPRGWWLTHLAAAPPHSLIGWRSWGRRSGKPWVLT